jgi:DNA excision repair protein ERCC-2
MGLQLRQWQEEKLDEALNVIKNGKTLVLSANPGAGKTIFALLLAKMLSKKAVFFVRTHSEFESVYKNAKMLDMRVGFLFGKSTS